VLGAEVRDGVWSEDVRLEEAVDGVGEAVLADVLPLSVPEGCCCVVSVGGAVAAGGSRCCPCVPRLAS
jgi:hypothetical protein